MWKGGKLLTPTMAMFLTWLDMTLKRVSVIRVEDLTKLEDVRLSKME